MYRRPHICARRTVGRRRSAGTTSSRRRASRRAPRCPSRGAWPGGRRPARRRGSGAGAAAAGSRPRPRPAGTWALHSNLCGPRGEEVSFFPFSPFHCHSTMLEAVLDISIIVYYCAKFASWQEVHHWFEWYFFELEIQWYYNPKNRWKCWFSTVRWNMLFLKRSKAEEIITSWIWMLCELVQKLE